MKRSAVRWLRRALLIAGASLLAYCAFVWIDAWRFQRQGERLLMSLPAPAAPAVPGIPSAPPAKAPSKGEPIGRMEIPRLDVSVIVAEGSDEPVLRRAVGHIPGTALPGQTGNTALAGHRDTFFRPLRNIRRDDVIRFTTLQGDYEYRVVSTSIVDPRDVAVLDSDGSEELTLITCYPFYFVGHAPRRFVVRAQRAGAGEMAAAGVR
jgi:sortase A